MAMTKPNSTQVVFTPAGALAAARTAQDKLRERVTVLDKGADPLGVTNAATAFVAAGSDFSKTQVGVPRGVYKLDAIPAPTGEVTYVLEHGTTFTGVGSLRASDYVLKFGPHNSWPSKATLFGGVFGYLEQNTAFNAYGKAGGLGIFAASRSSAGGGLAVEANIGLSAFGLNDYIGGASGVWGLYSTVLRVNGSTGPTHGLEIDVANLGPQVSLFPNDMFKPGQTEGIWLCTGGEATNVGQVYTASCAMAIVRNDSSATPTANFDKGIVFHSKAIIGTDGATGQGVAMAFAKGHSQEWYNNSNQVVSRIVSQTSAAANAQELVFSDFGTLFRQVSDAGTLFSIAEVAGAANRLEVAAAGAGGSPQLRVQGSDTNIDVVVAPKGTGVLQVNYASSIATTPTAFSASRRLAFKDGNGILWYIPISTVAW